MTRDEVWRDWGSLWAMSVRDIEEDVLKGTSVIPVVSAGGAAGYMSKYFVKSMLYRQELESAGFKRRWSRSRNWPGDQLVLLGTKEERWAKTAFAYKKGGPSERSQAAIDRSKGHPLLERVGTDLAVELLRRKIARQGRIQLGRLLGYGDAVVP